VITAGDVRLLSKAESTALSAVTEHVVTCQMTELIISDQLTVSHAVHIDTAFNTPHS